ncbi:MAG: ribbon-helix-helix protein, CopG family [Peptococcaceae bacterium]|nr:ribbon-helix-helix protein, CopG family [Peptococcaceae bacterium]
MQKVSFELDIELYSAVKEKAARENRTMSEIVRRICEDAVGRMSVESGMDAVTALVRAEVGRATKLAESRITKILVKASVAASTNIGLSLQCITAVNKHDATEMRRIARRKAAEYLKVKEEE